MSADGVPGGVPRAGDVLLKRYRVDGLIGEGGTGIVVGATDLQGDRKVAIKLLRRALESDDLRTRFAREALAIGSIASEHVVLVLDAGALDDGSPYMVLEHLEGRDLAQVLKEDGPLPVEKAVDCMLHVCEALQEAHAAGIIHRDLKPANLFLTQRADGSLLVKVVDFGLSKILDRNLTAVDGRVHDVTSAYEVLGSPRYMAPEQVRSARDVDGRADLWSVGAVLFRLLTGRYAFEADNNVKATVAVLAGEPLKLCSAAPDAPSGLEAVVSRCLEKDVTRRFQSAEELAAALLPFASERTRKAFEAARRDGRAPRGPARVEASPEAAPTGPEPPAPDSGAEAAPAPLASDVAAPTSSEGRRGWRVTGLALGALALVAGVLLVLKIGASSPRTRGNAVQAARAPLAPAAAPPSQVTLDAAAPSP